MLRVDTFVQQHVFLMWPGTAMKKNIVFFCVTRMTNQRLLHLRSSYVVYKTCMLYKRLYTWDRVST